MLFRSARWVFPVPTGVVAVGAKSVALVRTGSARAAVYTSSFSIVASGAVGSRIVVHGDDIATVLSADATTLHPVAEYPAGHWRRAFAPEPRGALFELTGATVRRWQLGRRRFDPTALPEAFAVHDVRVRPAGRSIR